ncbi:MAG: sodium:calcium antiporter, partial [Bacteroidales bacterium]|nr:sodium:calcium antiporter [Bacteroidales bacterium]
GTSLPEFITSIVALVKKRSQLALGNILGSNVFNLLLILGTSAVIFPTSFARIDVYDYSALLLSIILVWTSVYTGKKNILDRFDASLMLILFVAYMTKLFITL